MNSALIGVLVGGAITLLSTFGLEAWREHRQREETKSRDEKSIQQAVRLVVVELSEIDQAIREAVSAGQYWVDRMAGRRLPTAT